MLYLFLLSNPNKPVALDVPEEWPEFSSDIRGKFMDLNLENPHVIDTPHWERLHKFRTHVMSARQRMMRVDISTAPQQGN